MTRHRRSKEIIHEGRYAAEVFIDLEYSDESWSPTMSLADAKNSKPCGWLYAVTTSPKRPGTVASSSLCRFRKGGGDIAGKREECAGVEAE
jgi:hypothetical protein